MKLKLLTLSLIFILTGQWLTPALAQQNDKLLLQHWVVGEVLSATLPDMTVPAAGQPLKLRLKDNPQAFTASTVGDDLKFAINAYRIPGYKPGDEVVISIPPFEAQGQADDKYQIGAALEFTSNKDGWEEHDLALGTVVVSSINPSSGMPGNDYEITITGFNIDWVGDLDTSSIHFKLSDGGDDDQIIVNSAAGKGSTIAVNISISAAASLGKRMVTVDGVMGGAVFEVAKEEHESVIYVLPTNLEFSYVFGKPAPDPQEVEVSNQGNEELKWEISSDLPSWLVVKPSSGTLDKNTFQKVSFSINAAEITETKKYETTVVFKDIQTNTEVKVNVSVNASILADNGYIKSIYIWQEGDDTYIKWGFKNEQVKGAKIYRLVSSEFSKDTDDPGKWTYAEIVDAPTAQWKDPHTKGKNVYYLVMPVIHDAGGIPIEIPKKAMFDSAPAISGDYLGKDETGNPYTSWPVVKFDLVFTAGESKLIGFPFYPTNQTGVIMKWSEVMQPVGFANGALWYNDNGLMKLECKDGKWAGDLNLELSKGYWLKSVEEKTYTFTAALISGAYEKDLSLGSDMYSYAFPVGAKKAKIEAGMTFDKNENLWLDDNGLIKYEYNGADWNSNFMVETGKAFWYKAVKVKKLKTIP